MSTKKSARTVAGASAVDILLSLAGDGQKLKTPPVATLLSGADYSLLRQHGPSIQRMQLTYCFYLF